jgi:predicted RNA-binding protein
LSEEVKGMPAWLCVASSKTWAVVKKHRVWGAPDGSYNLRVVSQIKPSDFLAFYLLAPIRSIIGFYRATSSIFTETTIEPWNDRHYPYRIMIEPLSKKAAELRQPIRFDEIVGKIGKIQNRWSLIGRSAVPLTDKEFFLLCSLANMDTTKYPHSS